ncbi:MAG: Fic family protein [Mycoplasmataceae bacterium]|jgi:cell filamentation protein|nr:Fic family protein [Mycoplasmataceae bacterium]
MSKISIRFFNDKEVRAVWDEEGNKWFFNIVDICAVLTESKAPNAYWRWLKRKLIAEKNQTVSGAHAFKFLATDGKRRLMDAIDSDNLVKLATAFPNKNVPKFLEWLTCGENTIDGQSKKKAYALWESGLLDTQDTGSIKSLQQIHAYIFGGLYDFAGNIRTLTISKGRFTFCVAQHLPIVLKNIETMPETTFDEICEKYVEMNVVHPFMEGNGRSTRIWLDLIFKRSLKKCVDWSKIDKNDYLNAMMKSHTDDSDIKRLLKSALTDKINDREMFMKGIDYSYYYEEDHTVESGNE